MLLTLTRTLKENQKKIKGYFGEKGMEKRSGKLQTTNIPQKSVAFCMKQL